MILRGQVVDSDTMKGLPGATIELWVDNVLLKSAVAASNGEFTVETAATPGKVVISSVGYTPINAPYNQISDDSYFPLDKDYKDLENVTITSGSKKNGLVWIGLGLLLLLLTDKQK